MSKTIFADSEFFLVERADADAPRRAPKVSQTQQGIAGQCKSAQVAQRLIYLEKRTRAEQSGTVDTGSNPPGPNSNLDLSPTVYGNTPRSPPRAGFLFLAVFLHLTLNRPFMNPAVYPLVNHTVRCICRMPIEVLGASMIGQPTPLGLLQPRRAPKRRHSWGSPSACQTRRRPPQASRRDSGRRSETAANRGESLSFLEVVSAYSFVYGRSCPL